MRRSPGVKSWASPVFIVHKRYSELLGQLAQLAMFADDTNITIWAKNAEDLGEKLNNELNNVHNWLLANKLTVNVDKSEYMSMDHGKD